MHIVARSKPGIIQAMAMYLSVALLEKLTLENFTAFKDETIRFTSGLNVIVGQNGTGKTHILKAAYACMAFHEDTMAFNERDVKNDHHELAKKLLAFFKASTLDQLVRHGGKQKKGSVGCRLASPKSQFEVIIDIGSSVNADGSHIRQDTDSDNSAAVAYFLPPFELLTLAPYFIAQNRKLARFDEYTLDFLEETWRNTCLELLNPLRPKKVAESWSEIIRPLEEAIGGKLEYAEGGKFLLKTKTGKIELPLVAEGHRKFAMITRILASGNYVDGGTLFWDEPEANLNPALIKVLAKVIIAMCRNRIQVVLATHSLFLLRELDILQRLPENSDLQGKTHYIGLHAGTKDSGATVSQGATIDDIGKIATLDEDLEQSDRYLESVRKL